MKRSFAFVVIVLAGLAYLAGYWPERQRRQTLASQVIGLRGQLEEAQSRARLGSLLVQLLSAEDAVSAQNFGQAQTLSSQFFDAVRSEETRSAVGTSRDALEKIVPMRDSVTASLTRADPQALKLLRDAEAIVRNALVSPHVAAP